MIGLSEKQRKYELRALEAQINPHFIYNTLDCINWIAIEKNEDEISFMLKNLAEIMRYSTSSIETKVTIKTELDYITKYLKLQKVRFNDRFDYTVEISEKVREFEIYKLLFQPFIENAILHGINGLTRQGMIKLAIRETEDNAIFFFIRDNGVGIDESILRPILNHIEDEESDSGIGIRNAYNRMRIYFGSRFHDFIIDSKMDEGTSVSFYINRK